MLSGFNTNVRYRGVLFHVQTEDSGRAHPHVITHLFHGGNILASQKRGYEELLAADDLESQVKDLMDEQHAAMLGELKAGKLDDVVRERLGSEVFGDSEPTAAEAAAGATQAPAPPAEPARQKPLDEVVLEYLVHSAHRRKAR